MTLLYQHLKFTPTSDLTDTTSLPKMRAIRKVYEDGRVEYDMVTEEEAFRLFQQFCDINMKG